MEQQLSFWLDNLRAGLIIAILYIIKAKMQLKADRSIETHLRKIEKEMLILHHRVEKLIKGEQQK